MNYTKNKIKDDILIISYYFNQNGWDSANKVSYQRVLYFSAVLGPIFIGNSKWEYDFSNTIFGPYNNEISESLQELLVKRDLELVKRKIYQNRIEDSYKISNQGIGKCETVIFNLSMNQAKNEWFKIIVKALSLYGESFLSKLVKVDPNVINMNTLNNNGRIISDDSARNVSKEFFLYLKSRGLKEDELDKNDDLEILLMYFDVLFRKYKGDQ